MNMLKAFFKNYYGTILSFIAVFFAYKIATEMQYLDRYLYPQVGSIAEALQPCWACSSPWPSASRWGSAPGCAKRFIPSSTPSA